MGENFSRIIKLRDRTGQDRMASPSPSLPQIMTALMETHGQTAQQAALLAYLKQGDEAKPYLETVLTAQLASTLYKTLSSEDKYEAARTETTLAIAKWIKEHPRATQIQTREEVARQIELFKQKIETF